MAYVVDANVHVIAAGRRRYPVAPLRGKLPAWAGGAHSTAEAFLEHMRIAGVHQAALAHPASVYGYDNSCCLDSASRYPESFVALGAIDVADQEAGAALRWLVEQRGLGAIRFERRDARDPSEWLDAPATMSLWQEAARHRTCVSLPTVRRMSDLPALRRVLERFPTVRVLLRRMAGAPAEDGPPYEAAKDLFALAEFPNVYLTFSQHNIEDARKGKSNPQAFFEAFISKFGARRLMWGSFFPANRATPEAPYKGLVDRVREELSFLQQDDRDWLLGETARNLFPSLRDAAGQKAKDYAGLAP